MGFPAFTKTELVIFIIAMFVSVVVSIFVTVVVAVFVTVGVAMVATVVVAMVLSCYISSIRCLYGLYLSLSFLHLVTINCWYVFLLLYGLLQVWLSLWWLYFYALLLCPVLWFFFLSRVVWYQQNQYWSSQHNSASTYWNIAFDHMFKVIKISCVLYTVTGTHPFK